MQTFVRIVEANSFSKAAETMNLPRASLTATMQNLEAYLGTRLLHRTTRRISLTPDGAGYYETCLRILGEIDEAENAFRAQAAHDPSGKLRLDLPGALGRNLVLPQLGRFMALYPRIELVLSLGDRLVDLTRQGVDCAVRVGSLQDSSLVGRQIGSMQFATCAAPSYLQRHGTPVGLDDLERHVAVVHLSGRTGRGLDMDFVVDGKVVPVKMNGRIAVDDADAYVSCGLQGLGLIQAARYQVAAHLASGALAEVLPQWRPAAMPVSLIYPQGRSSAPRVRAFIAWISEVFHQHPDFQDDVSGAR
ncbi:LysR family transcriptional regulator [Noviherbaspirillum pedocola]|nr:LysR family transcriptional regulator [Noviherbaspirillum pedocola]